MPGMTGVELFERAAVLAPDSIRILVTGFVDVDSVVAAVNRGKIYKFIIKPFDSDDFRITVRRAIEAYELKREVLRHVAQLEKLVEQRTLDLQGKTHELERALERMQTLSDTDPLTGLKNRRFLYERLDADIALAVRHYDDHGSTDADMDVVFFMIDIDHFKAINDTYGHGPGDAMLVRFAACMQEFFRESDIVVRWGGEEFLVVSRFMPRREASAIAERFRSKIERTTFDLDATTAVKKTCCIGYSSFPPSTREPSAAPWTRVVDLADRALYVAKHSGRNAWVGIEMSAPEANADVLTRCLQQPQAALEQGLIRVTTSLGDGQELRWDAALDSAVSG